MHTIYLRRLRKVVLPHGVGTTPSYVIATFAKNIESFGYRLSEELYQQLQLLSLSQVETFYHRLVTSLKKLVGAHREFNPLYPNFPAQVMSMTEAGLYFHALMHYWTHQRPGYSKEPRPELDEQVIYRQIHLGSVADFESHFTLLLRSKTPYSPQDKEDVEWYIDQYRERAVEQLPEKLTCKENLGILIARFLSTGCEPSALETHIQTATDVLRIAVAMHGGDVSLAEPAKFGKFSRRTRALLLSWMEQKPNLAEDMRRWKSRWIRLGERLHPGEYASRFPKTAAAFDVIRNDKPIVTFYGQLEASIRNEDAGKAVELLSTRPGELARRLDHLLRLSQSSTEILDRFAQHANNVSTPVLLQVMSHFTYRQEPAELRAFFPKGQVANLFATDKPLPHLAPSLVQRIVEICRSTLITRFAKLPALGKCYLDPALKNYLVPFSQRSASKALRTLVRGSKLPLPECSTLRFFVWWKNGRSRADVDLSAVMYNGKYQFISALTYYNLKNFGAHHSGDIVDAPHGAAEFIDIDIKRCLDNDVRFVVMSLNSFTEQPYCDLPECFAGWMARQSPGSGEIFEPKTVIDKVDISANTRICLPAIFDIVEKQVIWSDIALTSTPRYSNNVHHNLSGVSLMVRALHQLRKTSLHTLFDLHIAARGEPVTNVTQAETVFSTDSGITPFDLERISAEFL